MRRITKGISTDRRIRNLITRRQACRRFCASKRPWTCLKYGVAAAQRRDFQAQGGYHPPTLSPSTPSPSCASPQSSQSGGPRENDMCAGSDLTPMCFRIFAIFLIWVPSVDQHRLQVVPRTLGWCSFSGVGKTAFPGGGGSGPQCSRSAQVA